MTNHRRDLSFYKKISTINDGDESCVTSTNATVQKEEKQKQKASCVVCGEDKHTLDKCKKFLHTENVKKRWDMASVSKACFCCLKFHKAPCTEREMCKVNNCEKYHHRLLHKHKETAKPTTTENFSGCVTSVKKKALLRMIPVEVYGPKGSKATVAFLDEGSTTTLMDFALAKELGVQGKVQPFCFGWTGGVYRYEPKAETVEITISGHNNNKYQLDDVKIINDLNLPVQQINLDELHGRVPQNMINLSKMRNAQPMLLIGQRYADLIMTRAVININENGPMLSKTKLGWVLHGPVETAIEKASFICCHVSEDLNEMVKKQFSLENFGVCVSKIDKIKSLEDQKAIDIAKSSITKINGRFQVNLPWKDENVKPPESKKMAQQRLSCLERKLLRNKQMAGAYQAEVNKLLQKGYARKVVDSEILQSEKLWFLPHFAVYNPNKQGKVRLVFDAAAESNGTSLNKNLLTGPDWLSSIVGILLRFRIHQVAFTADIREMFNQVQIADKDAVAQCFLWRDLEFDKRPELYQMKAMLFGTTSSPFLAQFVKNYNAEAFRENNPEAVEAIIKNHYVDDYLDSKATVKEAIEIIHAVIRIHSDGGFEIRQFVSNSPELMLQIPENLRSNEAFASCGDKAETQQKVLGLIWDAERDIFTFSTNTMHRLSSELLAGEIIPAKRKVLAAVNSVYDPLGLVSPITIKGRILMRDIWEAGLKWDDKLKGELIKKWRIWLHDLKCIENMKFPRCYAVDGMKATRIELHVFNDASSKAFSSAAYLRFCYQRENSETYETILVAAKARVSPLKHVTIPKLETLAAVLGCRLANTIQEELAMDINERFFWTDSRTVLSWINSERRMETFVANRIGEICEKSKKSEWYWVSTTTNVADIITRDTEKEFNFNQWVRGPDFLKQNKQAWNVYENEIEPSEEPVFLVVQVEPGLSDTIKWSKNLNTTLRTVAWFKRFSYNAQAGRKKYPKISGALQAHEIEWAFLQLCRYVQKEYFPYDLEAAATKTTSGNARLTKLSVSIDENDVLRISSRLERAKHIDASVRNPIVLDGRHNFTRQIIEHLHREANHTGIQVVVHKFKQNCWMPKMNFTIKRIIGECTWCRRRRAKPIQPKMGLIPPDRLRLNEKPFSATGVDYFGLFYIREGRKGRYAKAFRKRYGVLFTCLTTRAIHVEIAHSLSTDSCIMALRRMMARRGNIKVIWSDNGTNFRGASRELIEALEEFDERAVQNKLSVEGIDWKFIPANAPNFGGCWERLVGCFKRAIESVLSVDSNPSDETLRTIFCEAEHLVNSRPYLLESDHPDDDIGLCPNDILILQSSAIYTPGLFDTDINIEKRMWRVAQLLIDAFWKRFIKEYIPTMINRSKWVKNIENIQEGEVVVMKENTPRGEWPLGLVLKTYPGPDGVVRVVDLRTAKNTYRRPVNRLCKLGIKHSDKEDRAEDPGSQH